jgi:ribosomal protein L7/L12
MFRTPEDRDEEYKRLLKARKKIQAIKNRRMITGEGLLEAKRYMDNLELQMIKDGEMLGTHNRIQGLEASIRIADSRARRLP